MKQTWQKYYSLTQNRPPSPLLLKALGYVTEPGTAIDIGGGALNDTKYLLNLGFEVTVIDSEPLMAEKAAAIQSKKLHPVVISFANFDFPKSSFYLSSAIYALLFNPPDSFERVFKNIRQSLVGGGIFCSQFFGMHDEWSSNPSMTFHTQAQIEMLLDGMDILMLDEEEKDGQTANGTPKHWHVFHVIARKV